MADRLISNVPRVAMFIGEESYLPTFVGSLYAALQALGERWSYADLLAMSGAGNRLRWMPGVWDPSNIGILQAEEPATAPIFRALKATGWKGQLRVSRPLDGLGEPDVDFAYARREICASLEADVPVLALGILGPPEFSVIFGFQNDAESLIGWSYFQTDEGYEAEKPFIKTGWFEGMWGYLLLTGKRELPSLSESGLEALKAVVRHAHQGEVRGAKVGLAAWDAMLEQLEHDDFSNCALTFPHGTPGEDSAWQSSVQGRFFVYCDALTQIYERHNALPFYEKLTREIPEWGGELREAMAAWETCAQYGGFLWKYVSMDEAGFEKFRDPSIRKTLADEGRRAKAKDAEAVEHIEQLLARLNVN
ncbi:MAG: hypothetical protein JW987_02740 [Anaerolineaceae bacterium]|nr:hypothetical protein [Anaerolineaceae bacterium]